jgi:hypothetical protein
VNSVNGKRRASYTRGENGVAQDIQVRVDDVWAVFRDFSVESRKHSDVDSEALPKTPNFTDSLSRFTLQLIGLAVKQANQSCLEARGIEPLRQIDHHSLSPPQAKIWQYLHHADHDD